MEGVEEKFSLGAVDYVILGLFIAISAAIGVYYRFSGGKQKSTKEYLLADGNMPVFPVAFSLMASFMSSITLLGLAAENYQYGTQVAVINLSYVIGTPIAAYFFLPVFFQLQNASAYQYVEMRFGKYTRMLTSIAFIAQTGLYMGVVVYAPALALEAVTSLDKTISIIVIGVVCTFYSTIGGMKAVLISDVFQSLLMYTVVLAVIIQGSIKAGGLGQVWQTAYNNSRIEFFNFDPDPTVRHTFWTQLIGGLFNYVPLYASNQTQIQRLLTVRNVKRAQAALWINWPMLTFLSLSTCFAGLCVFAYYVNCDPLSLSEDMGGIGAADQLIPRFITDTLGEYPGVVGLCMAGIFSGALSTVSSSLNSLAAVVMQDFLKPFFLKNVSDKREAMISQVVALVFGAICLGVAFLAESLGGVFSAAMTILTVVGGPVLGIMTVGMFSTAVENKGALAGLVSGLAFSFWLGFGGPKPPIDQLPLDTSGCPNATLTTMSYSSTPFWEDTTLMPAEDDYFPLYKLSYMWSGPIGFLTVVVVAQIFSRVFRLVQHFRGRKVNQINPKLLSPYFPEIFRSSHHLLPESQTESVEELVDNKEAASSDSNSSDGSHKSLQLIAC